MSDELQTKEQLNEKIRSLICDIVNNYGPCRATFVATQVASEIFTCKHGAFDISANNLLDDFNKILQDCIDEEGIAELEYTHPSTDYKISSLLFPIGTKFKAWNGGGG